MSLLDIHLDDESVPTLHTANDGDERMLVIASWETVAKKDDQNLSNWKIKLEDPSDPLLDDIQIWLSVPDTALKSMDQKKFVKAFNRARDFFKCFGIPLNLEDTSSAVGYSGHCILGVDVSEQYGSRNTVREFVIGAR